MTNIVMNCPNCNCERDVSKLVILSDGMEFTCAFCDYKQLQSLIKNQLLGYIKELDVIEKKLLNSAKANKGKINNDDFFILLEVQGLIPRLKKLLPNY